MKTNRCLYCYKELNEGLIDFHPACSERFFGVSIPPTLSLSKEQLIEMASEITKRSITVPGVQPKLSLSLETNPDDPKRSRLTIVGLWGEYILKPQSESFKLLPENEDLTMHLARLANISTAEHTLLRTTNGPLAYVTKRFDRIKGKKIPMEDFCQLLEVPSTGRSKYDNGTMEKVGKAIRKFSTVPGLDLIEFFDISVFSFLTGNSDLHLKNFSIIKNEKNEYRLSPAYDLMSSKLAMGKEDPEEMALHINGKKNRIRKKDFLQLAKTCQIAPTVVEKTFAKYSSLIKEFEEFISISFLSDDLKEQYLEILKEKSKALELG
jgi:serine/threonine-protein kinase HipA